MPDALDHAQIIELSGADALAFAHAQFTSDVRALAVGQWQWSGWLDPSGRVRNFFALFRSDQERLLAWLPRGDSAAMAKHLSMYILRSKLRIRSLADYWLLDLQTSDGAISAESTENWILDLPGSTQRRAAIVNNCAVLAIDTQRRQAWAREDIAAGLPWISHETAEEFTPQALGLDRLGAISLDKGCYPGQEIVARLHYRGGNKRGCVRLRLESGVLPQSGERIDVDASPVAHGRILYAAPAEDGFCEALAVLPLDLPDNIVMRLESGTKAIPISLKPRA